MENIGHYLDQMRSASPLVHNITNFVAMNSMANVLLSAGASPAMVHSLEEVEDFAAISNALTVNIGTLEPAWVEAMCKAAKQMNSQSKPWVFDPVGVGATKYRQQASKQLLTLKPTVIRGNASEIMALAGLESSGQGVDGRDSVESAVDAARTLAKQFGSVVAVTGAIDIVTDGERIVEIPHGSYFMSKVTTMGCSLNGVIAAFCIGQPSFEATVSALTYYGIAGEIAENKCNGPGSFWVEFIDTLASLSGDAVTSRSQVTS
ncbi:MAG: Hydroxyethylthiazole kinase [Marinobacterium sp. xm-d-530]|jgi:hydroxyethylthiazole kinase|nr:MAG: Hydroxyethylthiazole kinase [Marinobacterium sp. xm-d-530]